MIKEVCSKLKEKRKELGFSLEYTVEKTKLHPSVIKDIENGDLERIGSTYLKGFMKIYASFLGVDLGSSLEEVSSLKTSTKSERRFKRKNIQPPLSQTMHLLKQISPETKKKVVIVLAAMLLLWSLFTVGSFAVKKISRAFKKESPKEASEVAAAKPESFTPIPEGDEVVVSVTANKRCFLRVKVDGKLLFEGALNKGAIETWRGNKEIEFKISDGSAVYLEVNGKSIPTLTAIRKPIKSLKITSSEISIDK